MSKNEETRQNSKESGILCPFCQQPVDKGKRPGDKPILRTTKRNGSVRRERALSLVFGNRQDNRNYFQDLRYP